MIAGQHPHADPRMDALAYGFGHFGAKGIRKTDQPHEVQALQFLRDPPLAAAFKTFG
jgi:hypothetical protein